jgi:DNA-binding transcriptional LysR family regulator
LRSLDIRLLRAFVVTADTGRVSTAAKECGYSQPAITQQIQSLEKLLGRKLLYRDPDGMALTEDGRRAYVYARIIVDLSESLRTSTWPGEDSVMPSSRE